MSAAIWTYWGYRFIKQREPLRKVLDKRRRIAARLAEVRKRTEYDFDRAIRKADAEQDELLRLALADGAESRGLVRP